VTATGIESTSLENRWTGLVAWASLAQGVCLSAILATRDAVTPLKVVCAAAVTCQSQYNFERVNY
jgi:hypothetical protein